MRKSTASLSLIVLAFLSIGFVFFVNYYWGKPDSEVVRTASKVAEAINQDEEAGLKASWKTEGRDVVLEIRDPIAKRTFKFRASNE